MGKIEELKAKRDEIDKEIRKINGRREKELLKESQSLVGNCYLYHNAFSGGDKFESYLIVTKVVGAWIVSDDIVNVNVEGIQVNDHPSFYNISVEGTYLSTWRDNPISRAKFMKAYNKVLKKLTPRI